MPDVVAGAAARIAALPPRRSPARRRQPVPAVTHPGDRACKSGRAVLLAPGILSPREDHRQERASGASLARWRKRHP